MVKDVAHIRTRLEACRQVFLQRIRSSVQSIRALALLPGGHDVPSIPGGHGVHGLKWLLDAHDGHASLMNLKIDLMQEQQERRFAQVATVGCEHSAAGIWLKGSRAEQSVMDMWPLLAEDPLWAEHLASINSRQDKFRPHGSDTRFPVHAEDATAVDERVVHIAGGVGKLADRSEDDAHRRIAADPARDVLDASLV